MSPPSLTIILYETKEIVQNFNVVIWQKINFDPYNPSSEVYKQYLRLRSQNKSKGQTMYVISDFSFSTTNNIFGSATTL